MDSILISHPAAPGLILSIPKNFSLDVAEIYWHHCLEQWTQDWKYQSNPSSTGQCQASTTKNCNEERATVVRDCEEKSCLNSRQDGFIEEGSEVIFPDLAKLLGDLGQRRIFEHRFAGSPECSGPRFDRPAKNSAGKLLESGKDEPLKEMQHVDSLRKVLYCQI